nr:MAG TPA: hypothetical protein [Caudoviricetes sp.]
MTLVVHFVGRGLRICGVYDILSHSVLFRGFRLIIDKTCVFLTFYSVLFNAVP